MPEPPSNVHRTPALGHLTMGIPPAKPLGDSRTAGLVYRPRRPTSTPLYPVVQHHLGSFLATAEDEHPTGWGVPSWVERDFRAYLHCGILAHGSPALAVMRAVTTGSSPWRANRKLPL